MATKEMYDGYRVIVAGDFNRSYEPLEPMFRASNMIPLNDETNGFIMPRFGDLLKQYGFYSPPDQILISPRLAFAPNEVGVRDRLRPHFSELRQLEISNHILEVVRINILPLP